MHPLRAVLVTGKGGVGKTTLTASLARYAAAQGKRVLCAEMAGAAAAARTRTAAANRGRRSMSPSLLIPVQSFLVPVQLDVAVRREGRF